MYRRISILFLVLLAAAQLQAQQAEKKLTLKEAIELGVANSKQLAISSGKVKEAQARTAQAVDKIWPEVGVSGMFLHVNTPNVSVSQSADNSSGSSDSPLAAFSNLHNVALLQASASMPVFNGFRYRNNRMMSEYLEQAARYDAQTTKGTVTLNTIKAVYQYFEMLETRRTVQETLKRQQQRVTEFKNQEAQQVLTRNDRLKAELQMNNVELALTEINNNVKLAEYNLIVLLGLPEETTITLDTVGMFAIPKLGAIDEYVQAGLTNRGDIRSSEFQMKASESNYKMARANRLPTLSLTAGYVNAYIPQVVNITNALNAGVSLKYSITGAIHASHGMQEARARQEGATATQQLAIDQTKVRVHQKYLKCVEQNEKLVITERSIVQAQENYQISQNKYGQGLLILSDYLDADTSLLQAQINHSTARADAVMAYYDLQESAGNLQ
jgi:outer membrane protein TolC